MMLIGERSDALRRSRAHRPCHQCRINVSAIPHK